MRIVLLFACLVPTLGACSSSGLVDANATTEAEDALETARTAYEYDCTTSSSEVLGRESVKMTISARQLSFVDDDGENVGTRDSSYRAPRGSSRGRFVDFGWGDDCSFKIVADTSAFRGASTTKVRVQCSSDDEFRQDLFACQSPRRVRLAPQPAPPPAPEEGQPEPSASARQWTCTSAAGRILSGALEVRVDDGAMKLEGDDGVEVLGARDRRYRSRTGTRVAYNDFGYGGDCEMTVVADKVILESRNRTADLRVRCKGDDYVEDAYRCTRH